MAARSIPVPRIMSEQEEQLAQLEKEADSATQYAFVSAQKMEEACASIKRSSHGIRELRRKISAKIPAVQIPSIVRGPDDTDRASEPPSDSR